MDKRKIGAIISARTGFLCGSFEDLQKYIEELMGRPFFTHELLVVGHVRCLDCKGMQSNCLGGL